MSNKIELLMQLKTQMVNFLDELIESFPLESDFVIFRIFVKDQASTQDIMEYVTTKLCPLKEMVQKRDEKFFLERNPLFENMEKTKKHKVDYFKEIWKSDKLDDQDREAMWQWFLTFIAIGNKYKEMKE